MPVYPLHLSRVLASIFTFSELGSERYSCRGLAPVTEWFMAYIRYRSWRNTIYRSGPALSMADIMPTVFSVGPALLFDGEVRIELPQEA